MRADRVRSWTRFTLVCCSALLSICGSFGSFGAAYAAAEITVTVHSDFSRTHYEGVRNNFASLATFTDAAACPTSSTCLPAASYKVLVHWGDGTRSTCGDTAVNLCGSTSNPTVSSPTYAGSGQSAQYSIAATHTYNDELNCPTHNCGWPVSLEVTNLTNGTTSGTGAPGGKLAIKDQPLGAPSGSSKSAVAGSTFAGELGSFHDANFRSRNADGNGSSEFKVRIDWGDATAVDTASGIAAVQSSSCGSQSGSSAADGCGVKVSGSHTYDAAGRYTVTATVRDGADPKPAVIQSVVDVAPAASSSPPPTPTPTPLPTPPPVPGPAKQPSPTPLLTPLPPANFANGLGSPPPALPLTGAEQTRSAARPWWVPIVAALLLALVVMIPRRTRARR